ncbi:MAG: extracellular solute-binding protein, partial [Ignavibacteriales bacterium]|nr:extracellular solute-binding protein [Ignavibacteriales bacterium]
MFDEARLPYPKSNWNWDDYVRLSRELTKDLNGDQIPDQYGTAFTNYYFYWIPWVWSAGGDIVDRRGYHATGYLNTSTTESVLEFLINLRNKHQVAPDVGTWVQAEKTGTNTSLFANGKIAMILDGHWRMPKFVKYYQEGVLDIGVAPLPIHPSGQKVNVMYESGWCVPVNTKHPEEAVILAAFMSGEIACRIRSVARLEIPANIKVANEAVANDPTGMEKVFLDEVPYCRQPWGSIIERFSEIEWTLQDAVDEVMLNNRPMHETMTEYAKRIDKELEQIRAHEKYDFKPIKEHSEIIKFLFGVFVVSILGSLILYLRAKRKERRAVGTAISFLAPSMLHLIVFIFTPIVFSAYLSFHRWDIVVPDKPFVGLSNFSDMFTDQTFWNALRNTLIYSF